MNMHANPAVEQAASFGPLLTEEEIAITLQGGHKVFGALRTYGTQHHFCDTNLQAVTIEFGPGTEVAIPLTEELREKITRIIED